MEIGALVNECAVRVFTMTGFRTEENAVHTLKAGAAACFNPIDPDLLSETIGIHVHIKVV